MLLEVSVQVPGRENLRNKLCIGEWCLVFLQCKLFSGTELCQMLRNPDLGELLLCTLAAVSFPWCVIGRGEILLCTCMV